MLPQAGAWGFSLAPLRGGEESASAGGGVGGGFCVIGAEGSDRNRGMAEAIDAFGDVLDCEIDLFLGVGFA